MFSQLFDWIENNIGFSHAILFCWHLVDQKRGNDNTDWLVSFASALFNNYFPYDISIEKLGKKRSKTLHHALLLKTSTLARPYYCTSTTAFTQVLAQCFNFSLLLLSCQYVINLWQFQFLWLHWFCQCLKLFFWKFYFYCYNSSLVFMNSIISGCCYLRVVLLRMLCMA